MSGATALDLLVQLLRPMLGKPNHHLVDENLLAHPNDPFLEICAGERFMVDEAYGFVGPGSTPEGIRACLRRADAGYSLNAVVVELQRAPTRIEGSNFVRDMADKRQLVVVRAHGGESFILRQGTASQESDLSDGRRVRCHGVNAENRGFLVNSQMESLASELDELLRCRAERGSS